LPVHRIEVIKLPENKSFSQWLRKNAERYLLEAAADDIAAKYPEMCAKPFREKGFGPLFWRDIFVPIYSKIPWSIRRKIILITSYPGGKRPNWKSYN
jgi:hypothetical protein